MGRPALAAVALAGALAASSCGGSGEEPARVASPAHLGARLAPVGAPPAEPDAPRVAPARRRVERLATRDLRKGDGRVAGRTSTVIMRYAAVDARSGAGVQSTYEEGAPFHVELGAGLLPPGLERGIAGMREGGRRRIEVPRGLARGKRALVYVVDLVRVL